MTHWKTMLEKEYLYAFDLGGREVTVTIESVKAGSIKGEGGKTTKKPVISFTGKDKKFALNVTNGSTIAQMYGNDVEAWVGKRITLFSSTTTFGGKTVDCIRIRPTVPPSRPVAAPAEPTAEPKHQREPGEEG